ncbi:MAG: ABC transporter ATP-binding protein [Rubrivivax sp.]|nr:ABC transporter ATP-binding protein [Rubrivivax sp.]
MSLLQIDRLRIAFGGIVAVKDLSLAVAPGAIHALIGPNGAGKTTVLNCISRFYDADAGSIRFGGQELTGLRDHCVADLGIARTFQNLELFGDLTVLDNVRIARHRFQRATLPEVLLGLVRKRREDAEHTERAEAIVESVGLAGHLHARVRDLPYGTQKLVELARAIALEPKLMLLDEPAAGMNNREIGRLGELLQGLRQRLSATLLLIEHNMSLVMSISERVTVMHDGALLAEGPPGEIERHEGVVAAYLGGGHRARAAAGV